MIDGKPKANPRFFHTNNGVNAISRIGIVMGILQLGLTINNLYQAYQGGYFLHQLKIETAKFMGAIIGSYIGAGVAMLNLSGTVAAAAAEHCEQSPSSGCPAWATV